MKFFSKEVRSKIGCIDSKEELTVKEMRSIFGGTCTHERGDNHDSGSNTDREKSLGRGSFSRFGGARTCNW